MRALSIWLLATGLPSLAPAQSSTRDEAPATLSETLNLPAFEGAIDPTAYVLGAGDHLLIEQWGLKEATTTADVSAEGKLLVPRLGMFQAGGQPLSTLRTTVENKLRAIYPSLHCTLTLVRPRSFLVHVVGAVAKPGTYRATPMTRVSTLVARAEPLPSASTRAVEVRRSSATDPLLRADLMRFTLLGDRASDPTVLDGDLLFVPLRQTEVEVTGAVRRPGRYELVHGNFTELLELAGGLNAEVANELPLRISSRSENDRIAVRSVLRATADASALHDGDRIHIPTLGDLHRVVVVEGAILGLPGTPPSVTAESHTTPLPRELSVPVPFVEGDGIRDLLNKVGGLLPSADSNRAFLIRPVNDSPGARQRIPIDIGAIASGRAPEIEVQPGDTLVVPTRRDTVLVGGAVQHPGLYPLNPDLHPADYLTLAGGATRTGDPAAARVLSHNGQSRLVSKATTVDPGDSIAVPERRMTTAEWIEITLILGNIAVASTALALSQIRR